jgi:hypothetical protein
MRDIPACSWNHSPWESITVLGHRRESRIAADQATGQGVNARCAFARFREGNGGALLHSTAFSSCRDRLLLVASLHKLGQGELFVASVMALEC